MRRIQYHRYGGPELMLLEEVEPPAPGRGQVLVRVRAAAANPMDWKVRNGTTKLMTGRRFPRGLGHDFAGTVAGVGESVTRFKAGDDVLGAMSMKDSGAFADMPVADEKLIVAKPAGLSYEEAAALPTAGVTALQSVIGKGGPRAGQSVFIHGCLGGVGRAAAQLALMHGGPWQAAAAAVRWPARKPSASPRSSASTSIRPRSGRGSTSFSIPSARCRSGPRARFWRPAAASSTST